MQAHPEGGYYREIYRARERVSGPSLPTRYEGSRAWGTSIYFLLEQLNPSRFHRLLTDEIWHFYAGSALTVHGLAPDGTYTAMRLGPDFAQGECFQHVIYAGNWFGATVEAPGGFALIGCTLAPGFEFADFELGQREFLLRQFPDQRELIGKLTGG